MAEKGFNRFINLCRFFNNACLGVFLFTAFIYSNTIQAQTIHFSDVTASKNARGNLVNNVSCYGHGVSFADINGDHLPDIYISNAVRNADDLPEVLYISNVDGTYTEEAEARGVDDPYGGTGSHGICFVDYDNDGDFDIFNATTDNRNRLYRNDGSGYFDNVTLAANLPKLGLGTRGVVAFDANNDGYMDLFGVNWGPVEDENNDPQITPPQPNEFYHNNGNGTFKRVTNNGLTEDNPSNVGVQGVTAIDVDNDGDMDAFVCRRNYSYLGDDTFGPDWSKPTPNQLFINNGSGHFSDEAKIRGIYHDRNDCNGTTFADYDNDGDLDAFVVPKQYGQKDVKVYKNSGNGYFTEVTSELNIQQWGFSCLLFDVDNDGDLDAYTMRTRREKNVLYLNDGSGNFHKTSATGLEKLCYDPRGGAVGDIDNDGDLDIYFVDANKDVDSRYGNYLFRNDTQTSNRWLKVLARGPKGDMGGFGTKIWVFEQGHLGDMNHLVGYRQVINTYGYLCQDDPVQHFGLGQRDFCDVKVEMLDGTTLFIPNVEANQKIYVSKPKEMVKTSGNDQQAQPETTLPQPLVVTVKDVFGDAVPGAEVNFEVIQGGGQISPQGQLYTDVTGQASVTLTLGSSYVNNIVRVTGAGLDGSPLEFTASVIGAEPAELVKAGGDNQTGAINTTLPEQISVRVKDVQGGYAQDFPVTFQITAGDGSINDQGSGPVEVLTDASGYASVSWTLGSTVGDNNNVLTVSALFNDTHLQNSPMTFTASAAPGNDIIITKESGDEQTGTAGSILADPLEIEVTDNLGNPHVGLSVRFQVLTGGGSVEESTSFTTNTDNNGQASAQWRLGTTLGEKAQTLRVTVQSGSQPFVTFSATAVPGPPVELIKVSGDRQTGVVGHPLDEPFVIEAFDQPGVPCVGTLATFHVIEGDGSFSGDSLITVELDDQGRASATLSLGATAGENSNTCDVSVEELSTVLTFTASSLADDPNQLAKVSGDSQVVQVGNSLPEPLVVSISDIFGNAIPTHPVTFTVIEGDGNFNGNIVIQVETDSNGLASTHLTLGTIAGICRVQAAAQWEGHDLVGSPFIFTATASAIPSRLEYVSGDSSEGIAGQLAPEPLRVRVIDDYNNPVIEHLVQYVVVTGGGSFSGQTTIQDTTDQNGTTAVTPTLGPTVGDRNNVFEARAFGEAGRQLTGSPIRFTLSGRASAADSLAEISGNYQSATVAQELSEPFKVQVLNVSGQGVENHPVTFEIVQGGGEFVGYESETVQLPTDENGEISINYRLGQSAGTNNNIVEARADDGVSALDGSPIRFYAGALPGRVDVDASSVEAAGPVTADGVSQSLITVTLVDSFSNPIPDKAVNLTATGSGNVLTQPGELSDENGKAKGYLASTKAGGKEIHATVVDDGLTLTNSATVEFVAGPAYKVELVSGDDQTGLAGDSLSAPFIVRITDLFNNPIVNYPVQFVVTQGGGQMAEPQPVTTDTLGYASSTLILGSDHTNLIVEARAGALEGSPVVFNATVTTRRVDKLEMVSGDGQVAPLGTLLREYFVVKVLGNDGQPFAGVPVNFTILEGDAYFASPVPDTSNEAGLAQALLIMGSTPGLVRVAATVENLADSVFFHATASEVVPHRITALLGNFQEAVVGDTLPQPLAVYVTDVNNEPVENVPVWFSSKTEGGMILDEQPVYSASNGVALARVQLGIKSGRYRFEAEQKSLQGPPVIFFADALPDSAVSIELLNGNNQNARPTRQLPEPLQGMVLDRFGNGVPDFEVFFKVTSGGGQIVEDQPVLTDTGGIAQSHWILGNAGQQAAQALSEALAGSPVEFTAQIVANSAPIISVVADTSISEGEELSFMVSVTDPEGDAWELGARNLPAGAQFDSTGTHVFSWTPTSDQAGTHEVAFIARDTLGAVGQSKTVIHVQNINHKPFVIFYEPLDSVVVLNYGEKMTFSVKAGDADNDTLTYFWRLAGMYAGSNPDLIVIPNQTLPNIFYIVVEISDPWETIQLRWRVEVGTSVDLSVFEAIMHQSGFVQLHWQTTEEVNNAGFYILRALQKSGNYHRINETIIRPGGEKSYTFIDQKVKAGKTYFYKLQDVSRSGHISEHGPISVMVTTPKVYRLAQNYPNPFSIISNIGGKGKTTIAFELPEQNLVILRIFNIYGQEIRRLVHNGFPAGMHRIVWDGQDDFGALVPSGVYYYCMSAGDFIETKKLIVLK